MPCLDDAALRGVANGTLVTGDPAREHLEKCEACLERYAEITRHVPDNDATSTTLPPRPRHIELPRGAALGRYVVLRPIAAGGMGEVFEAYDPELHRRVAVKLLFAALKTRGDLLAEARAMARLSHPNVVTVFDVGTHEDRVFLAMELVEGPTLRSWVREKPRKVREIVDAFVAAGRGLAAAHAASIIHRDFKAANVLIGNDGRVRVTDFGLARATDEVTFAAAETAVTPSGRVIQGTPGYIAPEQFEGNSDARTDQFSFCVALYDAVYGDRPFPGQTIPEYRKSLAAGRPADPPSGTSVPLSLRRILLRGMSANPGDRYPSMDALLQDLSRDPAERRRRIAMYGSVGSAIVIAVCGYFGLQRSRTLGCAREADAALASAWSDDAKSRAEAAFRASGKAYAADSWGRVAGVIDAWTGRWREASRDSCIATRVAHRQSDENFVLRSTCLDRQRRELAAFVGRLEKAEGPTVDRGVSAAWALPRPEECDALRARAIASDAAGLDEKRAQLADANTGYFLGRYPEALASAEDVLAAARAAGDRRLEGKAALLVGRAAERSGKKEAAERALLDSINAAQSVGDDEGCARAAIRLGYVTGVGLKRPAEGKRWFDLAESVLARIGGNPALESDLASNRGAVAQVESRLEDALRLKEQAVELRKKAWGPDHPDVAHALYSLAGTFNARGEFDLAVAQYRGALDVYEKALGPDHPEIQAAWRHGSYALVGAGRLPEAVEWVNRVIAISEKNFGKESTFAAESNGDLAWILSLMERHDEAIALATPAMAILEKEFGEDDTAVLSHVMALGASLGAKGKRAEAERAWTRCIELSGGGDEQELAYCLTGLGLSQLERGETRAALVTLERALGIRETDLGNGVGDLADTRFALARALRAAGGDSKRIRELAEKALEEYAKFPVHAGRAAKVRAFLGSA